ncbi:hypothetical protein [Plasmodium yoelii yoelii]|uniref:Uncharacterized protein n=1 Tax=Plasmodium yoelii yoelii TaxID=73239 RepID=Q7R8J1_PLAYO|nr:hypothetical protein [Plasmodium yoelii yoelii]
MNRLSIFSFSQHFFIFSTFFHFLNLFNLTIIFWGNISFFTINKIIKSTSTALLELKKWRKNGEMEKWRNGEMEKLL